MKTIHILENRLFVYCQKTGELSRVFKGKLTPYKPNNQGYIQVALSGKTLQAAHVILAIHGVSVPKGYQVDHLDRNPLNNRLDNLAVVTQSENNLNRGAWNAPYKGVHRKGTTYHARINYQHKHYYLGSYPTPELALQARNDFLISHNLDKKYPQQRNLIP